MNLFAEIRAATIAALESMMAEGALPEGLALDGVTVEPPRDPAHGDMATNAAMALAKPAGMKPHEIAGQLAGRLEADARVAKADVAGPGFLNLTLEPIVWTDVVSSAVAAGADFGRSGMGGGERVNVEFVSANPTGPLHVGHTRGAVFGDALASLLAFAGYDVTREYYINDGGAQVDTLARSVFERYREACGRSPVFDDGLYPGDYLATLGVELKEEHGEDLLDRPETEWLADLRDLATRRMMDMIHADLDALGVKMDVFFSEKSLFDTGRIEAALKLLQDRGLIYEGVLDPPKGMTPEDWEEREQTLFRSTELGDDVDRPVKKSDGSWTYFAPDIAYHFDKIERGFDRMIDVVGADHGGYVKRIKAAVSALSGGKASLDVKLTQLVRLWKDGAPFKMSKRKGNYVTLREILDRVGPDVARFVMLTRKNDAPLDFDFDKVLEHSKDNPVFYVQYAHARVRSVMRKAEAMGAKPGAAPNLGDSAERAVARKLAEWPRLVEIAARGHEPHRVAFYLYDLASEFHALWNRGNDDPSLRFLQEGDAEATSAKIPLAHAVGVVISAGLAILGVTPVEEMR